ncbi:DUF302 domain-containing protein [Acidithiobacillus caldus]|jgi:uncharacterized protein (DUF302 family)|uniref:DUF302 domain-containing protein n=3 Tax=Acidithiobacillus caldus TaxID=33059 RepID=F9ZQ44_ACICS|nr:DUF302 domain-containing protein [Acidithiobacillus caldus]AEK58537.1 conserved hypothetical protein [Acidithiobacillus caldus SM-1]AIA55577.1 hypothetical protein Acaty_c1717 [Acidithiobacillus caldus ATCC 51756]AUW33116.1 DUF302 domain-containing protein [Acidithiobacillus caldus]MBU2730790.1 DUF302 domain-containing protein [Acidithiobacillus caldus]MBU2736504.1 DUF302 domain-containing protein [Acidithiobacillus caldus ATCC 51756]
MSQIVFSVTSPSDYPTTVKLVTEALKHEGFGVLTTIDVAATLKAKLGVEHKPYIILGACNPHYAHQALQAVSDIGALLPCNVVVREEEDGRVSVVFMDPESVLGLIADPRVEQVGREVAEKLHRVARMVGK